jgi:hypothetical protein
MSVASEETRQNTETTANEESENERKLRTENENLTKEIVLLSQQKLELEVSQFSVWFYLKVICSLFECGRNLYLTY